MCRSYNQNSKRCLLYLNEKHKIAIYKGDNLLNKRTEIINTCRQRSTKLAIAKLQTDFKSMQYDTITVLHFKL